MIVTTGGRGARSSSASSNDLRLLVLVGGVLDRDLALSSSAAISSTSSSVSDCVIVHHLAEAHHDLDDLRAPGRRAPARGRGR